MILIGSPRKCSGNPSDLFCTDVRAIQLFIGCHVLPNTGRYSAALATIRVARQGPVWRHPKANLLCAQVDVISCTSRKVLCLMGFGLLQEMTQSGAGRHVVRTHEVDSQMPWKSCEGGMGGAREGVEDGNNTGVNTKPLQVYWLNPAHGDHPETQRGLPINRRPVKSPPRKPQNKTGKNPSN